MERLYGQVSWMTKFKKIWMAVATISLLMLIVIWFIVVVRLNAIQYRQDRIPVEYYDIGEYASYDHNYAYGSYADGYSIRANGYEILDTDEYLKKYGKTREDFDYSAERVCVVDVTVKFDGSVGKEKNEGIQLGDIMMCGLDYFADQNEEFFRLENSDMKEQGIILYDKMEHNVKLVFNLHKMLFSPRNWKHLEKEDMMLFLTARPVQKNLLLQGNRVHK